MKQIRQVQLPRQAGVGLVTAIFLLVVLAGLGVAIVAMSGSQQASANLDLQGARAYQAARAGLEWGMYRQLRDDSCVASTTFRLPAGSSLADFTVVVTCTAHGKAGDALRRHLIGATACNIVDDQGGCGPVANPASVRRSLEAEL